MSSSLQPGFPCFESRCPRHSNPYHTLAGLQNHLESVLTHFADRQTKRGDEARCHNVNRVLQELKLNCTPIITQQNEQGEVVGNWIHEAGNEEYSDDEDVEWVGEADADYMEEDEEEEEEDEEDGEDEVGEATSQPLLRLSEAPNTSAIANNGSASRQHTQNRWTSNLRTIHDHRDAFHVPNETIHISQGLARNTPI